MKYPREEQETIIRKGALDDYWSIYMSDVTMIYKLDKLVATSDEWKLIGTQTCEGEIVSKDYKCPKNLISIRTKTVRKSDEQKMRAVETLAKYRAK